MTSANPNQFGAPLDQNQYMEQEEEWEREGLLDPAWEKQQRKVRDPDEEKRTCTILQQRLGLCPMMCLLLDCTSSRLIDR